MLDKLNEQNAKEELRWTVSFDGAQKTTDLLERMWKTKSVPYSNPIHEDQDLEDFEFCETEKVDKHDSEIHNSITSNACEEYHQKYSNYSKIITKKLRCINSIPFFIAFTIIFGILILVSGFFSYYYSRKVKFLFQIIN